MVCVCVLVLLLVNEIVGFVVGVVLLGLCVGGVRLDGVIVCA